MTTIFDTPEFNDRLFFPRADSSPPPKGAVDRMVAVDGGAELHVRVYAAGSAPATILFFHGNGEVVADYDSADGMFEKAGARLIVCDYRGYGRSTGTPTLRAAIDDASKVLADVVAKDVGDKPLIVMGRSLGAGCAIDLYSRSPASVKAFILESGATDLVKLLERRGLTHSGELDDETAAKFDPIAKLRRGRAPLLVMHGAKDLMIHPREAEAAHREAGSADKRLVMIEGRGHNDISLSLDYWDELARFVESVVRLA